MAIITYNSNSNPMIQRGALFTSDVDTSQYYGYDSGGDTGKTIAILTAEQIVGLVPVFPCVSLDCREGKYKGDSLADDSQFPLPVFAQTSGGDRYYNDFNSFLFKTLAQNAPNSSYKFYLDKLVNGSWVQQDELKDNTYGTYYSVGSLCENLFWSGYQISWQKVLNVLGIGNYRFRLQTNVFGAENVCFASPQFCLAVWDCYKVDRTTKWEATINGGEIGNITKSAKGATWDFCCLNIDNTGRENAANFFTPISWYDSIRVEGMFGYEDTDYERKSIKYQTGQVVKTRDELILKFKWKAGNLPFWFHERFKAYGLMSDTLLVSDYNINNSDYNLNRYSVQGDGSYNPDYKNYSRYERVTCEFKAAIQNAKRTRCC